MPRQLCEGGPYSWSTQREPLCNYFEVRTLLALYGTIGNIACWLNVMNGLRETACDLPIFMLYTHYETCCQSHNKMFGGLLSMCCINGYKF